MFFFILDFIKKVYPHFEREPLTQSQFKEILMYMQLATNNKTLFDRSKRSGDTKKFSIQPHESNINEEARLWRQQVKNFVAFQQCCGSVLFWSGSGSNKPFYFVHLNFPFQCCFQKQIRILINKTDPYGSVSGSTTLIFSLSFKGFEPEPTNHSNHYHYSSKFKSRMQILDLDAYFIFAKMFTVIWLFNSMWSDWRTREICLFCAAEEKNGL